MSSLVIFALWLVVAGVVAWSVWHSRLAHASSAAVLDALVRFHRWTRDVTGTPAWLAGILAAAGVVVAGVATTVAVMWPLGIAVAKLQASVDVPMFDYFHRPTHQVHWWTSANLLLTQIGNRRPTEAATIVAAIGFAVVRTERRWVPLVAFPVAYLTEKYPQHWLALLVHRGHPPTTLGTWPSGGCARALLVYGLVAWFVSRRWRAKHAAAIAWSVVIVSQVTEAYTRVYLLKHWFTDVLPGGILFGGLLLTVWTAAVWLMDHTGDNRDQTAPTSRAAASDPAAVRTQTAASPIDGRWIVGPIQYRSRSWRSSSRLRTSRRAAQSTMRSSRSNNHLNMTNTVLGTG